jgi:ATP-grasp domain, R2K clade family 2
MPTLLLTPRQTEDAQALWRATVSLGWPVHRVHGWKVPEVNAIDIAIYAEPLLATHIAQTLGLELVGPADDWLARIPECWRKRSVLFTTMAAARECAEPRFIKSAAGKEFDARVYESGKDLPRGQMISDSLPVLIQEIVRWDVEYRCFVSERRVKAVSCYWRHGKDPRNDKGIWSQNELSEATEFCSSFLSDPNVSVPDACVVDVGMIPEKGWAVIESNAAWSSGIYGCDAAAILPVLLRACRPKL